MTDCRTKDVGVLCDNSHSLYWSTHWEMRAMMSSAFTHWAAITEPAAEAKP